MYSQPIEKRLFIINSKCEVSELIVCKSLLHKRQRVLASLMPLAVDRLLTIHSK